MITVEQVIFTIEDALKVEHGSMSKTSSSANIENWDSLGHLSILTTLDKMFSGEIANISEMAEAESIDKILYLLEKNSLI